MKVVPVTVDKTAFLESYKKQYIFISFIICTYFEIHPYFYLSTIHSFLIAESDFIIIQVCDGHLGCSSLFILQRTLCKHTCTTFHMDKCFNFSWVNRCNITGYYGKCMFNLNSTCSISLPTCGKHQSFKFNNLVHVQWYLSVVCFVLQCWRSNPRPSQVLYH